MIVFLLGDHKIVVGVCASIIAGDSSFTVAVQETQTDRAGPVFTLLQRFKCSQH
jgi:hypothetical protein